MTHSLIPVDILVFCQLCPTTTIGINSMAEHLEQAHGQYPQRWPDGGLVVDASQVPELIGDQT